MTHEESEQPFVSILVCTCNRQDNVVPTIRSIQTCGYQNFEVLILDQSRDATTERALEPLCEQDSRLRYVRLDLPNKPRALNRGRELAKGRYLLLTDDDCEVRPGWIAEIVRVFEADARVGCVFGDVEAGPCDPDKGYIPAYRVTQARSIFTLSEFLTMPGWGNFGMGANMALRADALETVGGWDPCVGPGAFFRSGDDHDVVARLLAAGFGLAFCPTAVAVHFGLRHWESMGADQTRYGFGMGAIFAKHLRTRSYYPGPLRVFGDRLLTTARGLSLRKGPVGLAYPRSWLLGLMHGFRHPVDRQTRCFVYSDAADTKRGTAERVAQVILRSSQQDPGK